MCDVNFYAVGSTCLCTLLQLFSICKGPPSHIPLLHVCSTASMCAQYVYNSVTYPANTITGTRATGVCPVNFYGSPTALCTNAVWGSYQGSCTSTQLFPFFFGIT